MTPLPLPAENCRLTVVIPARNESALIEAALDALIEQRDWGGNVLDPRLYDVIVFANGCDDDTAAQARAFATRSALPLIHVVECGAPAGAAHIGWARKTAMDLAAARFVAMSKLCGIIASTDADTRVDPDWIASTFSEITTVDAVAGRIMIADAELAVFTPALHALYLCEDAYRQCVAELEAMVDPVAHDPMPRHAQHFGASFAVRVHAYVRAGGIPPVPYLEDLAFYRALLRIDARVRHSSRVHVTTSARRTAQVAGGFGTFLSDLDGHVASGEPLLVEPPERTLARLGAAAALRQLYGGRSADREVKALAQWYGDAERPRASLDRSRPLGENLERMERLAAHAPAPGVPVERAVSVLIDVLRAHGAVSGGGAR